MKFPSIRGELKVAFLYLLFGGLWILLTDRLLAVLVPSISDLTTLQTYKGWAFVLTSAALIFILLRRELRTRQLAETKLRDSEERYRLITENASDLIFRYRIQPERKFEFISAASVAFTGYSPEELYANPDLVLKIIHPYDHSLIVKALAANVPPLNPLIEHWTRRDGTMIWVEQLVTYYKDDKDRIEYVDCVARDVTERKKAEEAVHLAEANYRSIFENASIGIYQSTPAGRYLKVNPSMARMYGYASPEEMLTAIENIPAQIYVDPAERARFVRLMDENGMVSDFIAENNRKDGAQIWIQTSAHTVKDASGETLYYEGFITDITERRRTEEALVQSEERYRGLFENIQEGYAYCQMLHENGEPQDFIYLAVNDKFEALTGLKDAAGKRVSEVIPGIRQTDPELFAIYDHVAQTGQPEKIETFVVGLQMWFSISVYSPAKGYFVAVFDVITERKRAEETQRGNARQINALVTSLDDIVFEMDRQAAYISIWTGDERLLFQPRATMLGRTMAEIMGKEAARPFEESIARVLDDGKVVEMEYPLEVSGGMHWFLARFSPILSSGASGRTVSMLVRDITERKHAQQALQKSEEKYRHIFENAMEAITQTTPDGKYITANPATARMLGYDSPQELIARVSDIESQFYVQPGRRQEFINLMEKDGIVTGFESEFFRKDGSTAWISENSRAVRDEHGALLYYEGTAMDITVRKRAEQALLRSEEKYRHIFENAVESITQTTLQGRFITANPAAAIMLGYGSPQEMIADISSIERQFYVQPGRRQEFIDLMEKNGIITGFESEVFRRDGSIAWVSENSRAMRDEHGTLLYYEGTTMDITESRRAQEQLQASEEKYRSLFINIPFSIAHCRMIFEGDTPVDYEYIAVNPAFEEMTGLKDVVGKKVSEVIPGYTRNNPESLAFFGRVAQTGEMSRWEHYLAELDVWYSFTVFRRATAEIVIVTENISSRKRAEAKIHLQVERLAALNAIDHAISSSFDLNLSLSILLLHAVKQLKADATDVLLFNPNSNVLEYFIGRGFRTRSVEATRLHLGNGLANRLIMDRQPIFVPAMSTHDLTGPRAKSLEAESFVTYCAVPLITKGKVKGVLEVFLRAVIEPDQEWLDFLNTLSEQAALAIDNHELFDGMQRSNDELRLAYDTTIEGWSHALDLRDRETEGHTQRVKEMTLKLARAAGIYDEQIIHIQRGILLHDIGKLGVPDDILLKPGALTDEEWVIMRQHPVYAYELISPIEFLRPALDIPYCHHEKWDGSGYPRGLKGEQIPLAARLFSVVDVWDALSSDRSYRKKWPKEKVTDYIRSLSGTYFDPHAVELFFDVLGE
jgi:PAS domain S-box-containing protein